MNSNEFYIPCCLCSYRASYKEVCNSNSRFYSCDNPVCGEYIISIFAMRQIENNFGYRVRQISRAHQCIGTKRILKIVGGEGGGILVSTVVLSPNELTA